MVQQMIRPILRQEVKGRVPVVVDWLQITTEELERIDAFIDDLAQLTSGQSASSGPDQRPNGKDSQGGSLRQHLTIMKTCVDVLWETKGFKELAPGMTKEFFYALIDVHDLSRNFFNGTLPLRYVDGVSEGLLKKFFPKFPRVFLHTIQWMTGEKSLPDSTEQLTPANQIALMLKAIDTQSKLYDGQLPSPATFFSEGGPYSRWLTLQETLGRFPFAILRWEDDHRVREEVSSASYAQRDQEYTMRGHRLIEHVTGIPIEQFWNTVGSRVAIPY